MANVASSVEELVSYIKSTKEYQMCISLKEKMKDNLEIEELVQNIKLLQKKYIRSEYREDVKKELDECTERLNSIPIYSTYLENLEKVNEMINYVKETLNDYFTSLFE